MLCRCSGKMNLFFFIYDFSDYLTLQVIILYCCCSVTQLCLTLSYSMDCSMLGFPVLPYLPEFVQIHVRWVDDAVQQSHLLLPPSPAFNLSHHQGLFQWVDSSHWVAKVLYLTKSPALYSKFLLLAYFMYSTLYLLIPYS